MKFLVWLEKRQNRSRTGLPHYTTQDKVIHPADDPTPNSDFDSKDIKARRKEDVKRIKLMDRERNKVMKYKQRQEELPMTDKERDILHQQQLSQRRALRKLDF